MGETEEEDSVEDNVCEVRACAISLEALKPCSIHFVTTGRHTEIPWHVLNNKCREASPHKL